MVASAFPYIMPRLNRVLIAPGRGGAEPMGSLLRILAHALAAAVRLGQTDLGVDVVLLGRSEEPTRRLGRVIPDIPLPREVHPAELEPRLGHAPAGEKEEARIRFDPSAAGATRSGRLCRGCHGHR